MLIFRSLVLSLIGVNFYVKAGVFVYPNPSITSLKSCVKTLSELTISPGKVHKGKVISTFKEALDYINNNAPLSQKDYLDFEATMGRRRGMNRFGDWSRVKSRFEGVIKSLESGASLAEHFFYLEGIEQLTILKEVKTQIPKWFGIEKKLLFAAGGFGVATFLLPPDSTPLTTFLGGLCLSFELLFRSAIFVSVNHQFRYDFVEYLVDSASKILDPQAPPVALSFYSDSEARYLDAVMVPSENPRFAVVISKANFLSNN